MFRNHYFYPPWLELREIDRQYRKWLREQYPDYDWDAVFRKVSDPPPSPTED